MLTKKDLELIDKAIQKGFQEFYFSIFEPQATANEESHDELRMKFREAFKDMKEDSDRHIQNLRMDLNDHEERINTLEIKSGL